MKIIIAGRRRIKDRHIRWEERYGKKSKNVKKYFEKRLPGSYFRWEGFDYETGHPYYIVVGPAISKRYGKSFFAGIKKLPRNPNKKAYSPSGKYFSSLGTALSHAVKMWGIKFPTEAGNYKKNDLQTINIPRHMKSMEIKEENSSL